MQAVKVFSLHYWQLCWCSRYDSHEYKIINEREMIFFCIICGYAWMNVEKEGG